MNEFRVGCSPLTNRIFAGKVLKSGVFGNTKYDITDDAISAVAQHLFKLNQTVVLEFNDKNYELKVVEVNKQ